MSLEDIFGRREQYGQRDLGDGRTITVDPLTFGRARLHIGPSDTQWYDDGW